MPLTGFKSPHNRKLVQMVMATNSSIFAFLDLELKVVCLSFDFWDTNFLNRKGHLTS